MQAWHSPAWLAWTLNTELPILKEIAKDPHRHYREFDVTTRSGKVRSIANPDNVLKTIQRRLVTRLLQRVPLAACVRGSMRGHSPYTNALEHRGQPVIVRIDIKDFFPSVTNRRIGDVPSSVEIQRRLS